MMALFFIATLACCGFVALGTSIAHFMIAFVLLIVAVGAGVEATR